MPELPEVEAARHLARRVAVGRRIVKATAAHEVLRGTGGAWERRRHPKREDRDPGLPRGPRAERGLRLGTHRAGWGLGSSHAHGSRNVIRRWLRQRTLPARRNGNREGDVAAR